MTEAAWIRAGQAIVAMADSIGDVGRACAEAAPAFRAFGEAARAALGSSVGADTCTLDCPEGFHVHDD